MDVATFLSAVRNKNNRKQIIDFPQEQLALKDHEYLFYLNSLR